MILTEVMVKVRLGQGLLELVDLNFDETWSEISSEGGHPVFLPGESQGQGSLVGCRLWGRTESDMTEVT